jgi:aminoglycoside phosphotransferase (APT) family kinase protein
VRGDWQAATLIHGDARLENFVFCRPKPDHTCLDTRLVDWELASIGDAAWDCANVMQHYWSEWASAGSPSPERWEALTLALTAFWETYTTGRGIAGSDSRQLFRRVIVFTGMRLLQRAYEHFASGGRIPEVNRFIQLARLLLTEPDQALKGFAVYGYES